MSESSKSAVVVGSGIAGIATALRLRKQGYSVTVFEANDYPGGKLTAFNQDGFRFDAGPSLFTLPYLVDELFELFDLNPRDYFNYYPKKTACHYFWDDGTFLPAPTDRKAFGNEVENRLGVPSARLEKHLAHSEMLWNSTSTLFMERSLHQWDTYFSKEVLKAMGNLHRLHLLRSMHSVNTRALKNEKLTQLFDRYATYNGSSPYLAPGVLNIIPHLEHKLGTYYPIGGMHEITQSLYRLAVDRGVQFVFNTRVDKIEVQGHQAEGVWIRSSDSSSNEYVQADVVVSNMDVVPTYRTLMPDQRAPERTLRQPRSSSALIFYWGVGRLFPKLDLHNIFFSNDYKKEFEEIFKNGRISDDPTVYVNISSKEDQNDAPAGKENWFVMVNVPGNTGQDWDVLINEIRSRIMSKVNKILNVDLQDLIENESVLDPRSIEQKTSSYQGSLYGAASNNRLAAFLRHPNFHSKIKGLYLSGGSAHPGGGIPLCLLSARITAELVQKREE